MNKTSLEIDLTFIFVKNRYSLPNKNSDKKALHSRIFIQFPPPEGFFRSIICDDVFIDFIHATIIYATHKKKSYEVHD